jgi:dTDP-4-dehydrorhamnose reductase
MNILIVGQNGMLGQDMARAARAAGHSVRGIDFPEIDITNGDSIRRHVAKVKPQAIINCAAYTAVDACETDRDRAFAVNALGAGLLAGAAETHGAAFVHFSTDYVFDGKKTAPYVESDQVNPLSVYGKSKLEGELLVQKNCTRSFIFRTAWLYGAGGNNFVKTIRELAKKNFASGSPLRVVNDQSGSPTYTVDVCRQTLGMLGSGHFGLYHCTSEGQCSWYDFAVKIVRATGIPVTVEPCSTAEFPRPARRPANSVLENSCLKKLGLNLMPRWEDAFASFLLGEQRRDTK